MGYSLVELVVLLLLIFGASSLKTQATTFITKAFFKERYDQYKTVLNFFEIPGLHFGIERFDVPQSFNLSVQH